MTVRSVAAVTLLTLLLAGRPAWATGELITDVRVRGNTRTGEDTVLSIAGVSIGDIMEPTTLEKVRERLNSSGLFSDVNVFWEKYRAGVRINVVVADKFPWAPVPTFSLSKGNASFGLVFVHGNLFGRGKQMLLGGRISSLDSGGVLAYRDPAMFGTWAYWQLKGKFQDQWIPEFDPREDAAEKALRESKVRSYGGEVLFGVAWLRKVKTQIGYHLEDFKMRDTKYPQTQDPYGAGMPIIPDGPAAADARTAYLLANLIFDFRAREYSITTGNSLDFGGEMGKQTWGSQVEYWKASVRYDHFIRIGRRVNFMLLGAGALGKDLPLWAENWSGGDNLRGYLTRQFRGDSQVRATSELSFPLLPVIKSLEVRGVVFYDAAAVWYRELPEVSPDLDPNTGDSVYLPREGIDARSYLPPSILEPGFKADRDIHNAVGGGIRFFLRSVSVPLVGIDYGYGIESRQFRLFIVAGA